MSGEGDLAEEILKAFADPRAEPWFPTLTRRLVNRADEERLRPIGLSLSTYGTERFLRKDPSAQRSSVRGFEDVFGQGPIIEQLSSDVESSYERPGLKFLARARINESVIASLHQAFQRLEQIPSLSSSTMDLVRSIHVLDAGDEASDVSHSDPLLPFSVFISIPRHKVPNSALRVMESTVHEAMHLQLSLIENVFDLVQERDVRLPSPWRSELRPPAGVLHGIYVFANIARAFELMLRANELLSVDKDFIYSRLERISNELKMAFASLTPEVLTEHGQVLHAILRQRRCQVNGTRFVSG